MTDSEFLEWIADRLVNVYGESENVDYVLKLRELKDLPNRLADAERERDAADEAARLVKLGTTAITEGQARRIEALEAALREIKVWTVRDLWADGVDPSYAKAQIGLICDRALLSAAPATTDAGEGRET